jgi:DNA-binding MltR family transcriptional regulator
MIWVNQTEGESAAIRELDTISDRAAAIVGAVLLENKIENALKYHLMEHKVNSNKSILSDAFRISGPLGPFSAKIDLAFMIGMYSADAWSDINFIREIRNKFAHDLNILNFDADKIQSLCNNIKYFTKFVFTYGTKDSDTPQGLNYKLYEENLTEKLGNPRQRYLLAVRFYCAALNPGPPSVGGRQKKPLCTPRL